MKHMLNSNNYKNLFENMPYKKFEIYSRPKCEFERFNFLIYQINDAAGNSK